MTLVLDATVVMDACLASDGFAIFGREQLTAPPLLWPEVRSALHQTLWRGEIDRGLARTALDRLVSAPVRPSSPARLGIGAWETADEFGWAKTYDAEYVALARILGCRLVTLDAALLRATARLGFVVALREV